jgi:hypothetical protein
MRPRKKKTFGLANSAAPYVWLLGVCFIAFIVTKGGELLIRLFSYVFDHK